MKESKAVLRCAKREIQGTLNVLGGADANALIAALDELLKESNAVANVVRIDAVQGVVYLTDTVIDGGITSPVKLPTR